ncbi:MAG: sulfatase [Bacteroidales bacterium]|nr:sulfatase [Bacteroidales bacterium]
MNSILKTLGYTALISIETAIVPKINAQEKPNILMFCVDDMNDWVGFLGGHPQTITPNMDRLASKGVNFTNAHCPAPGCSPSRNSLIFGIEPHNSGLYPFYNINNIEAGVIDSYYPLPLLFRNNGYYTKGITKVWHNPDNAYLQDSTWDEYSSHGDSNIQLIKEEGYYPDPYVKRLVACPGSNPLEDFMDYKNAMQAVDFLDKSHEDPFFLAIGFIRPHTPFIVPKENYDRFQVPIQEPPIKADDLVDIPIAGQSNAQIYVEIPMRRDGAWEKLRRGYLASINFIDDNVGRVMDALDKSPYADNTIIVLWSDHGFHLGEKRTYSKFSLWNEATRTPFIIYDPRGQNGNGLQCDESVGLINIYRTLCDMTGIEVPEYVDGISLTPWLDNPKLEMEKPAMTTWGRGNYTLRSKEWRYTRYFDGSEELYSETCDPNEWVNLANNERFDSIKDEFSKWLPKTEAPQVSSGLELYNVADADSPILNINSFLNNVSKYNAEGLQPPLYIK